MKLRYLMALNPEHSRQKHQTHGKSGPGSLPDADVTFIQQALWCKLPVGIRLVSWQPHNSAYPLDVCQGGRTDRTFYGLALLSFMGVLRVGETISVR